MSGRRGGPEQQNFGSLAAWGGPTDCSGGAGRPRPHLPIWETEQ